MTAAEIAVQHAGVPGSAAAVLAAMQEEQAAVRAAEVRLLQRVVEWAAIHGEAAIHPQEAWWRGLVPLAGDGAPGVAEDAVVELAAALGMSTDAGRACLGEGLELRYRLPRLWARLEAGMVPVWRARRIASATMVLSPAAAAWVDAQVAAYAHRIGPATVEALVADAVRRFQPAEAQARLEASADRRHVRVHRDQVSYAGTVPVTAELDLPDALDLDLALAIGAAQLLECGSVEPLDARRATALGELARRDLTLTYPNGDPDHSLPAAAATTSESPAPVRPVTLYLHLSESAVSGAGGTGRCETTRTAVDAEVIRAWCGSGSAVTVKPVIDLADHVRVDAWEVPDRLAERVRLRDGACVFPWCTRPARACDTDHTIPHARGGATCPGNLAPLCRRHHRMKTHAGWTYTTPEPGTHLWTSPHGLTYLRDHRGTLDLGATPSCGDTCLSDPDPPHP